MKNMPYEIKKKLRQLANYHHKAKKLDMEVSELIQSYGVDEAYLIADKFDKPSTEAYAFITNAEGDVEECIEEIEEVFLWHVNNKEE